MRSFALSIICLVTLRAFAGDFSSSPESQITPSEFEKKIDAGIAAIRSNSPFTVADAIMLIRVSNTLGGSGETEKEKKFDGLMCGRDLGERLDAAIGEPVYSKGMGLYFPKHDLYLGGSGAKSGIRDCYWIVPEKKREGANKTTTDSGDPGPQHSDE